MNHARFSLVAVATMLTGACHQSPVAGCQILTQSEIAPSSLERVQLRMSLAELKDAFGEPDFSPVEGQYVFYTGPGCKAQSSDRVSSCGLIAEFRRPSVSGGLEITDSLQSCAWGAVGE